MPMNLADQPGSRGYFHGLIPEGGQTLISALEGWMASKAADFITTQLSYANLASGSKPQSHGSDQVFHSNEEFWAHILGQSTVRSEIVELADFSITSWFPRSPGLAFTQQGREAGQKCGGSVYRDGLGWHYRLQDKYHLLESGVGSVRFKPIEISTATHWLCFASSDDWCHTGVPLAVPNEIMRTLDLEETIRCRIRGEVTFLPEFLEGFFRHWQRIPQIYLLVEQVEKIKTGPPQKITPAVFLSNINPKGSGSSADTHYVTFATCRTGSIDALNDVADWISKYAREYKTSIVTNFDQHSLTFSDAPFSLGHVMSGHLDRRALSSFYNEEDSAQIMLTSRNRTRTGATQAGRLRVFLCHAADDKAKVRELYRWLKSKGHNPWLDEEDLIPGQDWAREIPIAVRDSAIVLVCLSDHSVNKAGYVQKEIKLALDVADEQPEGTIFVIPAKLEECDVPDRLSKFHWVNLFDDDGQSKLLRALDERDRSLRKT
jgi:hypothetical protein